MSRHTVIDDLFIVDHLGSKELAKAEEVGCSSIIFNRKNLSLPPNISGIEAYQERGEGYHYIYNQIIRKIDSLFGKRPDLANLHGLSWAKPLRKNIYWSARELGPLSFAASRKTGREIDLLHLIGISACRYFCRQMRGVLRHKANRNFVAVRTDDRGSKNLRSLIIADAGGEFEFFNDLISNLEGSSCYYVWEKVASEYSNAEWLKIDPSHGSVPWGESEGLLCEIVKAFNFQGLDSVERTLLSFFWPMVTEALIIKRDLLQLFERGVRCIFFFGGQDRWQANIGCQLARATGVTTINLMNGTRFGWPQDGDVEFDQWIVWDSSMRDRLVRRAGVDPSTLKVIGNLKRDCAYDAKYRIYPKICGKLIDGGIRIAVMGSPNYRENAQAVIESIEGLMAANRKLVAVYRPHPREPKEMRHSFRSPRFVESRGEEETEKVGLYRLLYWADVVVVFGSTVGIEAEWFGCRVIDYRMGKDECQRGSSDENVTVQDLRGFECTLKKFIREDRVKKVIDSSANRTPMVEQYAQFVRDCIG